MKAALMGLVAGVSLVLVAGASAAGGLTEVSEVINVQKFGAVPNINQDQSAAIQAAINSATNGSTIYFPAGVYYSHSLRIINRAGLAFVGDGPDASILKRPATAPPDARIALMDNCTDMVISRLGFDVNGVRRYGGFVCLDSKRVTFTRNHFFDSNKQPLGIEDRYPMVFGAGSQPSEDIVISQNRVEDLQVEVDYARGVRIVGNTIARPVKTAGIVTCTIKTNGGYAEDFEIAGNTIIDPRLEAGAITVDLDPPTSDNALFRNIRIHDNVILYTAALRTATNEMFAGANGRTCPPAFQFGTGDNSLATHGNDFDGISFDRNTIWIDPSLGNVRYGVIFGNASAKSGFKFKNLKVTGNVIFYDRDTTQTGWRGEAGIINISEAESLDTSGNVVRRIPQPSQ
jgi:Pectate lyase superfamily protein